MDNVVACLCQGKRMSTRIGLRPLSIFFIVPPMFCKRSSTLKALPVSTIALRSDRHLPRTLGANADAPPMCTNFYTQELSHPLHFPTSNPQNGAESNINAPVNARVCHDFVNTGSCWRKTCNFSHPAPKDQEVSI